MQAHQFQRAIVTSQSYARTACLAVCCLLASATTPGAQTHAQTIAGSTNPGLGPRSGPFEPLTLLARADVRQELELIADQQAQLLDLRGKTRREARDRFAEIRTGGAAGAQGRIRQVAGELQQRVWSALSQILLPHQLDRLRQIQLQRQLRNGGAAILVREGLVEQLEITEDQRAKLQSTGRELEAEYRRRLQTLRAEMREKVLAVLSPEQRQRLDQLTGAPFEFQENIGSAAGPTATQ